MTRAVAYSLQAPIYLKSKARRDRIAVDGHVQSPCGGLAITSISMMRSRMDGPELATPIIAFLLRSQKTPCGGDQGGDRPKSWPIGGLVQVHQPVLIEGSTSPNTFGFMIVSRLDLIGSYRGPHSDRPCIGMLQILPGEKPRSSSLRPSAPTAATASSPPSPPISSKWHFCPIFQLSPKHPGTSVAFSRVLL